MKILYAGSSSSCFELDNSNPYYAPEQITVCLDGNELYTTDKNVFSVYDLHPDTEYTVEIRYSSGDTEQLRFHTAEESCCINVRDFGAVGDGVHEDTGAIQAAINFLPSGGRLFFPEGTYLTLPLSLKSHMTMELSEKAVLLGSTQRDRYPIIPAFVTDPISGREIAMTGFEGQELASYQSLIQAAFAEDIAIVGKGCIDGNAGNGDWWKNFEQFPASRPRICFFNRCSRIMVHGITVANSASWQIHPFYCEHVSIFDCMVQAPKISPNTDAIDPECCDYVDIIGCRFSVGDDCIAIKAAKIDMGRKYLSPANHHTIRNCLMQYGHGAVVLGSEVACGVQNLSVTQCYFRATDRGLRIKTRRGRGKDSIIHNVIFDNIRMENVLTPIVVNMWYNCCDPDRYTEYVWSRDKLPVDDRTPHLGSFTFRNLECTGAEVAACYIDGLPESPIESVALENISIRFSETAKPGYPAMLNFGKEVCCMGLYLDNVRQIRINNVKLEGVCGENLIADHYETIETDGSEE